MNFITYIKWRIALFFRTLKPCRRCRGSDGHCTKCNEYHNLYKKDWQKCYMDKQVWR